MDDAAIVNYLHAKYPSNGQNMVVDLLKASFDTLTNALHRNESSQVILCYRSFVVNKVPLLMLSSTAGLYVSMDYAVPSAINQIEVHTVPPLSSDTTGINDILRNTRQEFIQACQLHHVISDSIAQTLLTAFPASNLSNVYRYSKDNLVTQCIGNIHKAEELIGELEGMSGNAGAISIGLAEVSQSYRPMSCLYAEYLQKVLQRLCQSKETMSLRALCNALSRRLSLLDIVLQYVHISTIMVPLCSLLNEWTHDEDQSEFCLHKPMPAPAANTVR